MNTYVTGSIIKALRESRSMTQADLAEQIGVSSKTVSKWETGQSEPSANNLAELAQLLDISIAELVEPEPAASTGNPILRRNLEVCTLGGYTGMVILSGVRTDDPAFLIYIYVLVMIFAGLMGFHIFRLPAEVRLGAALKELAYCAIIWGILSFLTPLIGNVFAGALVLVCCLVYAVYIRFPESKT